MNKRDEHLETLTEIRSLMERSSRFLSFSGLSGVGAGVCALIGALVAYVYLEVDFFKEPNYIFDADKKKWGLDAITFLTIDALVVFITALLIGTYFSRRKAKKLGYPFWDKTAERLAINIGIPLATGGLFCLILTFKYGLTGLVAPTTLIFYGLTLINASKYTFNDLRFLGLIEIALGLIGLLHIGYGLLLWAIGFGVLHIVYGIFMYLKYDR